jgi:hypothetical protein
MIFFMKRKPPSVTLIWMYKGKNAAARRAEIQTFDYENLNTVESIQDIPGSTDVCVFWMDDDKPVTKSFITEMTKPLIDGDDFQTIMHFWSGNAISLPKKMLDATPLTANGGEVQSLLKLLLPVLDTSDKGPAGRLHVAFSSTERLAPLSMEPVGCPS